MAGQISEVIVLRLPLYARALRLLEERKTEVVSSQELGAQLGITATQIRKDLSYFGRFGKQGKGYNVKRLLKELQVILGLDREWLMALIGVGRLGRAILGYEGFAPQGFRIVAAFDSDPNEIGRKRGNVVVQHIDELEATVRRLGIQICILAVPPSQAQQVIDNVVRLGIKAILNYVPIAARVAEGVWLRDVDPVLALQTLTFHLKSSQKGNTQ